jgi:hypothetical protein
MGVPRYYETVEDLDLAIQSYFDENFPMGVNVGGYAIEYEKAFYSGTTYANSANSSCVFILDSTIP